MGQRRNRLLIFGPDSVHTHKWANYVRSAGWDVSWVAYGPSTDAAVVAIPVVRLELGGRLASVRTIFDLAIQSIRFRRLLRRIEPDIVQTHWLLGPAWIAALAGTCPIVATAWGSDVLLPFPRARTACFLTRLLGRRIHAITHSSDALQEKLLEIGFPRERLHRVLHGVDRTRFRPQSRDVGLLTELGVDPELPVLLSPRGVVPVYSPDTVLNAFEKVVKERRCTLLLRVPAQDRDEWERLRSLLGPDALKRVVTFTQLEHSVFARLLASCDVVISVSRSEGASVTVMEAIFCERPLIVSDIPQNREWVRDATFGSIVPVGDSDALASAIEGVLANPVAAAEKCRLASADARKIGDEEAGLGRALLLYEKLLSERH
jgi:glycosyltransferase involved in cell wall biosynthesis